jgi:hypothetical protein
MLTTTARFLLTTSRQLNPNPAWTITTPEPLLSRSLVALPRVIPMRRHNRPIVPTGRILYWSEHHEQTPEAHRAASHSSAFPQHERSIACCSSPLLRSAQAVVASKAMSLWVVLVTLGLVKLVVASLMLWLPFRYDTAMRAVEDEPRSDDEGGSKVSPGTPGDPHPRLPLPRKPRRGPHGSGSPSSPPRVRTATRRVVARASSQR